MSQRDWQLEQGDAIARFLFSPLKAERFAEFYTGEGALPDADESYCRQVFRQSMAQRVVDPDRALPCSTIAVADERGIVSFSDFSPRPFHHQRWLQVDLYAPYAGNFSFRLATCGAIRIWCSGVQCVCFTPLSRNLMSQTECELPLLAGKNRLLIHLDQLAERDTLCALQILYQGSVPLGFGLTDARNLPEFQCLPPRVVNQSDESARRLLTVMQQREYGPYAETLLLNTLRHISAREECCVFSVLPLLQLWRFHQREYFPDALWRRVKSTLLGFRYWQDERGCDAMGFRSENHALAFHAAQYLAGQFFPEALFVASARRGRVQQAVARERLASWFARAETQGLTERNHPAYYPTDYRGLLALQEMADDIKLRKRAGQLAEGAQG